MLSIYMALIWKLHDWSHLIMLPWLPMPQQHSLSSKLQTFGGKGISDLVFQVEWNFD
jgi:hypothetical protein